MTITRHEIRKITAENRGRPIISQALEYDNIVYLCGLTAEPPEGDVKSQTAQVLRRIDELLHKAGTDKSKLLTAQIWLSDIRMFEDHNAAWNEWVDPVNPPVRACVRADLFRPGMLVEIMVTAAKV